MNRKENKMADMKMGKLIAAISVPLMISMLVQALYNIVDGVFVAKISEHALTATSIAYPAQMLMLAVAVGTGVGINSLLSRRLGQKDYDGVNRVATTGLLLSLISSLVFILFGIFGTRLFIGAFADNAEIEALGIQYLQICMIGCSGIFLATTGERLLQSTGNTFLSMIAQAFGAVINIILDPLLIFGVGIFPKMGIQGAALATVIGQWGAAVMALALNARKNPDIHFILKGFRFQRDLTLEIYKVGVPTMIMQTMGSLMMIAMNAFLIRYTSTAVAAFGVYYKLYTFVYMPVSGLAQGLIPIIGFNYGAKNGKRVMDAYRITLKASIATMIFGTVLFLLIPSQLLGLYGASEEMLGIGIPMLRIMGCTFPFAAVTITIGFACSGLGNGMVSMVGTLLRQLLLLVPLAWLFGRSWGIHAVWYAGWISEGCAMIYALFSFRGQYRKKVRSLLQ